VAFDRLTFEGFAFGLPAVECAGFEVKIQRLAICSDRDDAGIAEGFVQWIARGRCLRDRHRRNEKQWEESRGAAESAFPRRAWERGKRNGEGRAIHGGALGGDGYSGNLPHCERWRAHVNSPVGRSSRENSPWINADDTDSMIASAVRCFSNV